MTLSRHQHAPPSCTERDKHDTPLVMLAMQESKKATNATNTSMMGLKHKANIKALPELRHYKH